MVNDLETGKPRGFAFVEFEDAQAALSAIRNMNEYELNGRQLRVNFSNSSHLESLATKLGMDMMQQPPSHHHQQQQQQQHNTNRSNNSKEEGTTAIADALRSLAKADMYDIIFQFKAIAEKDPDEARRLLCAHPQLPEAVLHLMSKLDMIQTPVASSSDTTTAATVVVPQPPPIMTSQPPPPIQQQQPPQVVVDPRLRADPRMAAAAAPTDPRAAARADPRVAAAATGVDPRVGSIVPPASYNIVPQQPPPPTMNIPPPSNASMPPPPMSSGLDPAFIQQVLSLTPQQIAQLPPDKQQSILALRHQLMGGR
mmetsp:Transcript_21362/g.30595  ORF Transcript_21362/g.30595 Transcript_21362/m.30595 type:complete len:311 (-) Transcript_21362:34-966(-)